MAPTMNDIFSPYRTISSRRDADELAAVLLHPQRERPAVVVSTTKNGPIIDPAALAKRLGPGVDVHLLANAALAYDLQDKLPPDTSVYGGAARCYPPGTGWTKNSAASMVRLAYTEEQGRAAIELLAEDVADMDTAPVKVTSSSVPRSTAATEVEGTVSVILEPDGVLVKLDDGIARIDTSILAPGISPALLFSAGQKLRGTIRENLMSITSGIHTPADAAQHAAKGLIVPALVASTKAVTLYPGLSVRHASGGPVGAVVAVRVDLSGKADGKAWKLSTVTDPEAVSDALPFIVGGEPWIRWDPTATAPEAPAEAPVSEAAAAPVQAPATPTPAPVPSPPGSKPATPVATAAPEPASAPVAHAHAAADEVFTALDTVRTRFEHLSSENMRLTRELEALRQEATARPEIPMPSPAFGGAELERLRVRVALMTRERAEMVEDHGRDMAEADDLAVENARLLHLNETLREQNRTERSRAARARQLSRDITDATDDSPLFADAGDQFRHEVYLEWATRIPAGSKAETPLAAYGFVNGFLKDVAEIQGVDRSKIVAVAVEVLTGLADSMPGRDMHRLRAGLPGASNFVEHPEYGTAWRVALQIKTASARRMHFWRGTDGMIRFAAVGVHDDMGI
ncbi:MAG TPA: hypothetical protein VF885_04245 [Arthrobacter sp.]